MPAKVTTPLGQSAPGFALPYRALGPVGVSMGPPRLWILRFEHTARDFPRVLGSHTSEGSQVRSGISACRNEGAPEAGTKDRRVLDTLRNLWKCQRVRTHTVHGGFTNSDALVNSRPHLPPVQLQYIQGIQADGGPLPRHAISRRSTRKVPNSPISWKLSDCAPHVTVGVVVGISLGQTPSTRRAPSDCIRYVRAELSLQYPCRICCECRHECHAGASATLGRCPLSLG